MKKNFYFNALAISMMIIVVSSCQKEPKIINEEELITTVVLSVQKFGSSTTQQFTFNDPDGVGGIPATVDSIIIEKAAQYNVSITLLNTSMPDIDTLSNEVLDEGDLHQFFYSSTTNVLSGFTYLAPNDLNGNPIGLNFSMDTWNWELNGLFKITLRHAPNKNGVGVNTGDITNANGETDIEVEFPVRIY
ncbi:MAG TPA: hypothetical protein PLJ42_10905 [Chitinophagales bacterium]|jgi:hypothetical protein|nr:hypothetical protein [Chitinophagales bacterium]MBP6154982.1 hypothetical protein [Chitinophagales bacterium]HQV79028.1 hypothetical protein [Chitinophagales bacterium]HQW79930.1 hypothetical protein [Chitinophagales bacterium]HRB68210.1 hypothetical protein [Chitinophagales bacterium]